MKILHVMAGGAVGGAENIFLETVLALADSDMQQAVVTRPEPFRVDSLKAKNIPVWSASFNKYWRFPTRKAINEAIKSFQPDIVQYWMGRAGTFAVDPKDYNNSFVNVAWYGGYYNREKRFPLCPYHVVLTDDLKRHVRETGVDDQQIGLIRTIAKVPAESNAVDRAAPDINTPNDATVLLALARLHWKKGLDVLLKSAARLPDTYVWIAGDGPLKEELETLAKDLKIESRVRFLGWRNDRFDLLKAADICTFPSRYEPFGTVTVDAWAAQKPLVAAKSAGPKATIKHEEDGLLVEIDDIDGLTSAIQRIMDNKDLSAKMVANGFQRYQDEYTPAALIRDSKAFYSHAIEASQNQTATKQAA